MDTLSEMVRKAVESYTGQGLNGYAYLTISPDNSLFTVVDIANIRGQRLVSTSLIVRLVNEQIVIEYDDNNKPLVDALVQVGIPRSQIILAYAGEPVAAATS